MLRDRDENGEKYSFGASFNRYTRGQFFHPVVTLAPPVKAFYSIVTIQLMVPYFSVVF